MKAARPAAAATSLAANPLRVSMIKLLDEKPRSVCRVVGKMPNTLDRYIQSNITMASLARSRWISMSRRFLAALLVGIVGLLVADGAVAETRSFVDAAGRKVE